MKEYIERAVALEILKRNPIGTWRGAPVYSEEIKSAADEIGDLPVADVAEVVRCRECSYRLPKGTVCQLSGMEITGDDFCNRGQRKEAANEVSEP